MEKVHSSFKDIEKHLQENQYLTGDSLSIVDVLVYNEVLNVMVYLQIQVDEYEKLSAWKQLIEKETIVEEIGQQFIQMVIEFRKKMEKKDEE